MDSIGLGSIQNEWILNLFLLIISLATSIYFWKKKKNIILAVFIFSALGNLIFYLDAGAPFYDFYNLKWFIRFTLNYWPWINIALLALLVINHLKKRNEKAKF